VIATLTSTRRAGGTVLCLNRRQVAFGPETTLTAGARATYAGEIVGLPGGELRASPAHHHHCCSPPCTLTDRGLTRRGVRCSSHAAGVTGGALGCWIVFYSLSYSAESLAHALLPGLVVAPHGHPLLLGGAVGLLVTRHRDRAADRARHRRDTAVAVVVTRCSAPACCSRSRPTRRRGCRVLFGGVLGVSNTDVSRRAGH
jgi:hypothetical protein